MTQDTVDPHETETSGSNIADRSKELADQRWDRSQSVALAKSEGIDLNDEHWSVIVFMRNYYFSGQDGNKYLRQLFSEGPVTQGSRLANLRTPAYASDPSFGTSY